MLTFTERIKLSNNLKLLEHCFVLMSERGIDPCRFVDWYIEEGIHKGNLTEGITVWIQDEIFLNEGIMDRFRQGYNSINNSGWAGKAANFVGKGVGNAAQGMGHLAGNFSAGINGQPQPPNAATNPAQPEAPTQPQQPAPAYAQHISVAAKAIDYLSRRVGRSGGRLGDQQFLDAVVALKKMLDNPQTIIAQQPQAPVQPQPVAPTGPSTAPMPTESSFSQFTNRIRSDFEIKSQLRTLQEYNIDPLEFVNWYEEIGQHLEESWWDDTTQWGKDFLGNLGANIRGAWNKWGHAGRARQNLMDKKRDKESVTNALQALNQLQQSFASSGSQPNQEFEDVLSTVVGKLQQIANGPQDQPDPQDQGQSNPQDSQVDPNNQGQPDSQDPNQHSDPVDPSQPDPSQSADSHQDPANQNPNISKYSWGQEFNPGGSLYPANPNDSSWIKRAVQIFKILPQDQRDQIDKEAHEIWAKKGYPQNQSQEDQDKDKATAMYDMIHAHESIAQNMPSFFEYLRLRSQ